MDIKLDILVFAAHPDDAELSCSGTIISHVKKGLKVGIVDLTLGELGTRGTIDTRKSEAANASKILGLSVRENLEIPDGFIDNSKAYLIKIISAIRKYKPEIIICNAITDRHPDHGSAAELVVRAIFLSGLVKIETGQEVWRPKNTYHYIQDRYINPDFIVDVSAYWPEKMQCIRAFETQFYNPNSKEPMTYISNPDFMLAIEARGLEFGHAIGVKYGEGFTIERKIGVSNLTDLI